MKPGSSPLRCRPPAPSTSVGTGEPAVDTVDGWSCRTDTGAQGTGIVGRDKDGPAFHTRP